MTRLLCTAFCIAAMSVPALAASQQDVQDKIRALEQQLEALKQLKATQDQAQSLREKQCRQVVPYSTFCTCLSSKLPDDVSFEQYVRVMLADGENARELTVIRDACGSRTSP